MQSLFLDRLLNTFMKLLVPAMPEWKRKKEEYPRLFYNIWAYANPTKAPPAENFLDKERSPPARPLPLEFPNYMPPSSSEPLSRERMNRLRQIIAQFKKPSDASDSLFTQFNISLESEVPLSAFVPTGQFEQRPFLFDSDLTSMLNELSYNNEDAFRDVLRMQPLEGRTKPRLAYARNFFVSLEDMSRYWDDTKDEYYKVEIGVGGKDKDGDHEMKAANGSAVPPVLNSGYDFTPPRLKTPTDFKASEDTAGEASDSEKTSILSTALEREVYRGYRLGNSAQMPPASRVSAIRNLTRMLTHKFNCRDFDNGLRERLKIKDVVIPPQMIMYTFNICRIPNDRDLARMRFMEGPVMGVYCRHEAIFKQETKDTLLAEGREKGEVGDVIGEEFDFLKEVGGLLMLALQRARDGKGKKEDYWKQETKDWWWAQKPRWGGGETKWGQLASEQFEDEDPSWSPRERELQLAKRVKAEEDKRVLSGLKSDDVKVEDLTVDKSEERGDKPLKKRSRLGLPDRVRRGSERGKKAIEETIEYKDSRRLMFVAPNKKKWFQDWKEVRPNSSPWEEKLIYKSIGKVDDGFDDVYQIGCVNHHVCLTRMTASRRYLHWIEKGSVEITGSKEGEDVLRIQRSRWFDLFDVVQRKEFLIGMWRVMCWLNRNEVSETEFEKMGTLRREDA